MTNEGPLQEPLQEPLPVPHAGASSAPPRIIRATDPGRRTLPSLDYVNRGEARAHSRLALVSIFCWAVVVLSFVSHVLLTETTTGYPPRVPGLQGLEPAVRTPLLLGELLLWVTGIVTGVWGTLRRGRRRWLAVLGLTLCVLTAPAAFLFFLFNYAPMD